MSWMFSGGGAGGGGGTPGGSTTQVQYNLSGAFAGDPSWTFVAGTGETFQNQTAATNVLAQSSPAIVLGGTYWTGSVSANDQWTFQNVIANGANGAPTLTITHTGSTGNAALSLQPVNDIILNTTNGAVGHIQVGGYTALTFNGNISTTLSSSARVSTSQLILSGGAGFTAAGSSAILMQCGNLNGSAGSTAIVSISMNGSFNPTSGTFNMIGLQIAPTINQTGTASGNYTMLLINPTQTAALGTANLLIDCQVSNTSKFAIDNTGKIVIPTTNTATTATAGANGALPAQAAGYLIVTIGGTAQKIPYFAN